MSEDEGENMPIEQEPNNNEESFEQKGSEAGQEHSVEGEDEGEVEESQEEQAQPEELKSEEREGDQKAFTFQEAQRVVDELRDVTNTLTELKETLQAIPGAQDNIADALRTYASIQNRIYEATEAQLPQEFRMPTKRSIAEDRAEREGREEITHADVEAISDEEELKEIERWFQRRFADHESRNETYEERAESLTQIISATTRLEYDPRTEYRELGKNYKKELDIRRGFQRVARVWASGTPEQIQGVSEVMTIDTFKELFTMEGVAEAYQEYVKMGDELQELRKLYKDEDEVVINQLNEIQNFFNHGGEVEIVNEEGEQDSVFLDEAIETLRSRPGRSEVRERVIVDSEKLLQARKIAGRLASITLEAADKNYELLPSGDFQARRVVSFKDNFEDGYTKKTRGIWEDFDLGFPDFITDLASKAKKGKVELKDDDDNTTKIENREDFINNIGNGELWEQMQDTRLVAENEFSSTKMFRFNKATETRALLYEFMKDPDSRKFLELGNSFKHISGGVGKDKEANNAEVAKRQIKLRELLDKVIEFGYSEEGEGVLEDFYYFRSAEAAVWIQQADNNELITREQRDYLMNKYVNFNLPIPGITQEGQWELAATLDFYNAFNKNKKWGDYMEYEIRRQMHAEMLEQIRNYMKS